MRILFLVSAHNSHQPARAGRSPSSATTSTSPSSPSRSRWRPPSPAPPRADRVPDAEDDDPAVDLRAAPVPDRAPGAEGRSRPVVGSTGRSSSAPASGASRCSRRRPRSTATSGRAGGSRCARRARAACIATRCAAPRSTPSCARCGTSPPATWPRPRLLGSSRLRAPAPAPQTGGPRDRLERRHHRDGAPADPRRGAHPGVLDAIEECRSTSSAAIARTLRGRPGLIAQRDGAVCRATVDGAVWITHLKAPSAFKLPATHALGSVEVPEVPAPPDGDTWREIAYEERAGVGYLHFDFYNGAMSTAQCRRLLEAYRRARSRPTRVIVLMGGRDFFSNGIHLNVIEAAEDPGRVVAEPARDRRRRPRDRRTDSPPGRLGAGRRRGGRRGAVRARGRRVAREDVVLGYRYGHMGGLYGSEYWTYLLPPRDRPRPRGRADLAAVRADGHPARGRDRPARRRVRRQRRALPRARAGDGEVLAAAPDHGARLDAGAAPAAATSRSSRCPPTAPRNW